MPGMGPPPKAPGTARRRNATVALTSLPAAGRQGPIPDWPLPDDIAMAVELRHAEQSQFDLQIQLEECDDKRTVRRLERQLEAAVQKAEVLGAKIDIARSMETEMWAELWATPQATMWERLAWRREVAQYVRWKVRGEIGDLDAAKEARQWSDRLGLNPLAMLRLRLEIERVDEAAARGNERRTQPPRPRARKATDDPRQVLRAVN